MECVCGGVGGWGGGDCMPESYKSTRLQTNSRIELALDYTVLCIMGFEQIGWSI
jgi:hypothetical protein